MKTRLMTIMMLLGSMAVQKGLAQETETPVEQKPRAIHTLIVDASPGWITSKVFTPVGTYRWRFGMGGEAAYRCLYQSGYGFGLEFLHNQTGYPVTYHKDENMKLDYFGASIVYGGEVGEGWTATVSAGMGYAHYTDADEGMAGFGMTTTLNIERAISQKVAVGLSLKQFTATFSQQENQPDDYVNGFKRFSVNFGLRVCL